MILKVCLYLDKSVAESNMLLQNIINFWLSVAFCQNLEFVKKKKQGKTNMKVDIIEKTPSKKFKRLSLILFFLRDR